jgi:aminoglycoside phosphotransferase family enzyme/predicted kinase
VSGVVEDQTPVIALLSAPATHAGQTVERIDTHAAVVFLAATRAYKLKRAVRYDYLDFSTPDLRRAACEAELRLNRRTAPTLYRRVLPVTREDDGALVLDGAGAPVDWVLEMERFPQEALFDRLAADGRLDLSLMPALARAIAAFHREAEPRTDHGGRAGMAWVVEGNAAGFAEFGTGWLAGARAARVTASARAGLDRWSSLLDARRDGGYVRQCHGDLHLRNIVLLDGHPTLFDGVEFNDEIACIDVLYDLAFLLMDLWRRHLPRHANAVWNRYLAETDDLDALALLPLFLSCRAAVRAKTSATAAALASDAARRDQLRALAGEYLAMAEALLEPPPARLVAVGGLSGTGKSTLALGLAPAIRPVPGAVVLRSDEVRKQLAGVAPLDHLPPAGYARDMSARVYATLTQRARRVLAQGHSVIVDAVYQRADDRGALARLAVDAAVPFTGLWLEAPDATLMARVEARVDDPSDADASVIRLQRAQAPGAIDWHRVDASAAPDVVLARASDIVAAESRPSSGRDDRRD